MKKLEDIIRRYKKLFVIAAVAVMLVIALVIVVAINKEPEFSVLSESSLKEVIEIDELATLEYMYNSIATVKMEDAEDIKYYVCYEGTVKLGIDFEDVKITIREKEKEIAVVVPEVKVMAYNVDPGSLDFIFEKKKYETETVTTEALQCCEDDLYAKVQEETSLFEIARENAITSIEALLHPWIEQVDSEYKVTVE